MLRLVVYPAHQNFRLTEATGILRNISPLPAALNASSIDIDQSIALPLITPLLSYSLQDAVEEVQKTLVEPVSVTSPDYILLLTNVAAAYNPSEPPFEVCKITQVRSQITC